VEAGLTRKNLIPITTVTLMIVGILPMSAFAAQHAPKTQDDPDVRLPVTQADVRIVQRAQEILDSPSKWNRADDRTCPTGAKTFSLYCALEIATNEITGKFEHRGAAMQEARFVIDEMAPNSKKYHHRLMDYNNDPTTTFADIQTFFRRLQNRVAERLKDQSRSDDE
jgi:hypothetical protein